MTTTTDRLDQLSPRIEAAAIALAFQYQTNVDDLAQTARLAILEHAARSPEFLEQTDSYIIQFGIWRARDMAKREWIDHGYTGADLPENDAGDLVLPRVSNPWPAIDLRLMMADVIADLDHDLVAIFKRMSDGFSQSEIAADLGIERTTVYRRRLRLAEALR